MRTNRRNFLKKAAVTAPGFTLLGTVQGMSGKAVLSEPDQTIADQKHDDGWLNAADCGTSGSTFQTIAVTKNGSRQINVADVGDFNVEKLNLFVPVGHYMLAKTIRISNAQSIIIEGSSSVDTILDLSEGEGACFSLFEGTQVTIRNFRMLGFMGFDERDRAGGIVKGSNGVWGFGLKHCNGITIGNTERVLIENWHAKL